MSLRYTAWIPSATRLLLWTWIAASALLLGAFPAPADQGRQAPHLSPREDTVFVTASGRKYHRATCGSLRGAGRALSRSEASADGFTPCARCNPLEHAHPADEPAVEEHSATRSAARVEAPKHPTIEAPHTPVLTTDTLRLPIEPEADAPYSRKEWVHWIRQQGCRNTRALALEHDSRGPVTWDERGCRVTSGLWLCPYTRDTIREAKGIDVDHFVPLSEAHASGGWRWDAERRRAYANDLADSLHLLSVAASANRSKGDGDPAEWMPPDPSYHCPYLENWVRIKSRWNLAMDSAEFAAVRAGLIRCRTSGQAVVVLEPVDHIETVDAAR